MVIDSRYIFTTRYVYEVSRQDQGIMPVRLETKPLYRYGTLPDSAEDETEL